MQTKNKARVLKFGKWLTKKTWTSQKETDLVVNTATDLQDVHTSKEQLQNEPWKGGNKKEAECIETTSA